jgi:amino acid transporter
MTADPAGTAVPLRRRLGLPLLVLYGTGITIGAGIYVLIGEVAGHAGGFAPWSFLLAAAVMAFTVASYAELSTRFPVSAGEAAYVMAAFRSRRLATAVGLLSVAIGVISSAAVALGSAGYIQQFIALPSWLIVPAVLAVLGGVAAWGILESVLLISTVLYVLVAAIAVSAVSAERLSASAAPLSLVFREVAGVSPMTISAIAIVATLNTILAQMTMAARVVYGLAREGSLPAVFARVHPRSRTPLAATALVVIAIVPLALLVPMAPLAELTSLATLSVFAVVNLALLWLRYRGAPSLVPHVTVPVWVPATGLATCAAMIAHALLS